MALTSNLIDDELLSFMEKRLKGRPLDRFKLPSEEASPTLEQETKARDRDYIAEALGANNSILTGQPQQTLPNGEAFPSALSLSLNNLKKETPGLESTGSSFQGGGEITKPDGLNGQLSPKMLVSIGGGHKLQPAAAAAFKAAMRDAAKDGVKITFTDSYRDLATQHRLAKEKGLYSQGGLAAKPGTSNHGWGLATDVDQGREWLAKHGAKYGLKTIPREPWHWEYAGGFSGGGGGGGKGALNWLIGKESSGSVHADNPTSTAFGLGQLLIDNREKYGRELGFDPNTTNRNQQLAMMREYIEDRYGNARRAKRFHKKHGWY